MHSSVCPQAPGEGVTSVETGDPGKQVPSVSPRSQQLLPKTYLYSHNTARIRLEKPPSARGKISLTFPFLESHNPGRVITIQKKTR